MVKVEEKSAYLSSKWANLEWAIAGEAKRRT